MAVAWSTPLCPRCRQGVLNSGACLTCGYDSMALRAPAETRPPLPRNTDELGGVFCLGCPGRRAGCCRDRPQPILRTSWAPRRRGWLRRFFRGEA